MLFEAEACQPTIEEFAALLNISPRSFDRALAADPISFRELSKWVRFDRACAMLRDRNTAVGQVAYRLEHNGQAAFSHAFRAVKGCSPSQYRRGLRKAAT